MTNLFERGCNSRHQGDAGMGIAIAWFACNGYTVCVPLTDSQRYDLVVGDNADSPQILQRVQVKSATKRNRNGPGFEVDLRTHGGNRSQPADKIKLLSIDDADLLFVVSHDGERYLIPVAALMSRTTIVIPGKYASYRLE